MQVEQFRRPQVVPSKIRNIFKPYIFDKFPIVIQQINNSQQVSQLALRRAVKESFHTSPAHLAFSREIYGRCHIGKILFNLQNSLLTRKLPLTINFSLKESSWLHASHAELLKESFRTILTLFKNKSLLNSL